MDTYITQLYALVFEIKKNFAFLISIIILVAVFNALNWLIKGKLYQLGLRPRSILGLAGIIFSPLLHGNFWHLTMNAVLFFILANMLLIGGHPLFYEVTAFVVVLGGLATWAFGRNALHVGASGLNMGYFGFLLIRAYQEPSLMSVAIAFVLLYYFGGMFLDLFPREEKVSWEGHLFGFIAGVLAGFIV